MSTSPHQLDAGQFLLKDYELKVGYLSGHLGRMWTRFNFFLTIHSALIALSVHRDNVAHAPFLGAVGLVLAFLWYLFAARDNHLVEVYRRQVAHTFFLLGPAREAGFVAAGLAPRPDGYAHAGSTGEKGFDPDTDRVGPIPATVWQNRWFGVSVTEMGVVFAVAFAVLWLIRLLGTKS